MYVTVYFIGLRNKNTIIGIYIPYIYTAFVMSMDDCTDRSFDVNFFCELVSNFVENIQNIANVKWLLEV